MLRRPLGYGYLALVASLLTSCMTHREKRTLFAVNEHHGRVAPGASTKNFRDKRTPKDHLANSVVVDGALSKKLVHQRVKSKTKDIEFCYKTFTETLELYSYNRDLAYRYREKKEQVYYPQGEMLVNFVVSPEGKVTNERVRYSEFKGARFHHCVLSSIKSVSFPKAKEKTKVEGYRFEFDVKTVSLIIDG